MTDPESVYRVKPELPLFHDESCNVANNRTASNCTCEQAHTRRGMPATSYKAAASVSLVNLGRTKERILSILRNQGPMTDEHIWARYLNTKHYREDYPNVSPSGLRSRRSELVKLGLVCDSGQRAKTQSGRESIVWRIK